MNFAVPESQRDSSIQPKVGESASLPWVTRFNMPLPQRGCDRPSRVNWHNPFGVDGAFDSITQGSSFLATAGLNDIAPLGQRRLISWRKSDCEEREKLEDESRQAAAVLPEAATLDKIMRYETKLERQIYRAMAQLERMQRMRRGEVLPAPLTVEVSERT